MLAYGSSADQVDEIARIGKSTVLESLVRFCDAVETLYTRDYLRRPTPRDLQRLLQKAESRGFPGMIGSIDCMHWQWKKLSNCLARVAGSQNNLNVLGQSPVFNDVLRGEAPNITYEINNTIYQNGYYLADGIYPRWTTFVKTIPHSDPISKKILLAIKRGTEKMLRDALVSFKPWWAIIRGAARLFDDEVLRSIMMTCIILNNMIVEDEYDYDADEVYEPNHIDTAPNTNL
ncbi:hypothetical protein L3X38_002437 [Prunus dulcis]|uniref:Protein ALP1-like n=1 Tax=Prunus dulcis TaxID=3755 RepID=A0AAD4WVL7_PRUDU|nr:hypothetical protein L3X38_002437 [Prunus dulcis]